MSMVEHGRVIKIFSFKNGNVSHLWAKVRAHDGRRVGLVVYVNLSTALSKLIKCKHWPVQENYFCQAGLLNVYLIHFILSFASESIYYKSMLSSNQAVDRSKKFLSLHWAYLWPQHCAGFFNVRKNFFHLCFALSTTIYLFFPMTMEPVFPW
jgi:hypothetical protein